MFDVGMVWNVLRSLATRKLDAKQILAIAIAVLFYILRKHVELEQVEELGANVTAEANEICREWVHDWEKKYEPELEAYQARLFAGMNRGWDQVE